MKRLLLISALLLITLCACGDLNAPETAPQPEEETIPEAAFETEAAQDDLTPLEKEALYQADAMKAFFNMKSYFNKNNDDDSEDNMPSNYGGCFIDDEGTLNICVVGLNDAARELYYTACETEDILFKEVAYSYKELEAAMEALNAAVKDGKIKSFSGGIRIENNRVETTLGSKAEAEAAAKLMSDWPCIFFDYVEPVLTPSEYGETPVPGEVTITAEYNAYPINTESINLFFTNGSDKNIYYSHYLSLEVLLDGYWYAIPYRPGVGYIKEILSLGGNLESHISAYFPIYNYELTEGSYRIVLGYSYSNKSNYDQKCFAEFNISKDAAITEPTIVINEGQPDNKEQLSLFLRKYYAGIKASLRLKEGESDTRYTYNGTALSVNGTYYYYCYTTDSSVFLTTYVDLAGADPEFIYTQDIVCIDKLVNLLSEDERARLLEKIRKDVGDRAYLDRRQTVLSDNGEDSVFTCVMKMQLENGDTIDDYQLFFYRPGKGKILDSSREDSGKPLPVYVFFIKDRVFGAVYRGTDKWEVKTYDTEKEAFLDTWTTADIEGLLTETFGLTKSDYRKE